MPNKTHEMVRCINEVEKMWGRVICEKIGIFARMRRRSAIDFIVRMSAFGCGNGRTADVIYKGRNIQFCFVESG